MEIALSKIIFSKLILNNIEQLWTPIYDIYDIDIYETMPTFSEVEGLRILIDMKSYFNFSSHGKCSQLKYRKVQFQLYVSSLWKC